MTTTDYLQREIRRTELSVRRAERKPNTPLEEIEGLHEKLEHLQEALEAVNEYWQRVHEQRGWTAGEPLTLEQLRGAPHGKIRDETLQHICVRANELAQAHSPAAHIDLEKWEPCEHCKPSKNAPDRWGPHQFPIDDSAIYYYDVDDGWEGEEINFCPWCGRPLTDEAWAELEKRIEVTV